jgi:Tfp pilus assembly protein PilF
MLRTALAHLESGRYGEAEQLCRRLLAEQAGDGGAATLLALSLQAQRRLDEAIPLLDALAAAPAAGYEACNNLGNALREAGRHAEAETALRRALARGGEQAGVLLNLGLNALDLADPDTAMHWLDRALLAAPDDVEIRTFSASAAFDSGDLTKARQLLAGWTQWPAADAAVLAEAAWLLFRLDDGAGAEILLQRALQRDAQHPRVLLRAAGMHERCNRLAQAQALADALGLRDDLDAGLAEDLALLRAALASRGRDAREARRQHERLLADGTNVQDAALHFSLARACDKDGDAAAAMQALALAHSAKVAQTRRRSPGLFDHADGPLTIARHRLDAAQFAAWPIDKDAPDATASPIFIVGFPRSGTTLLETMLDAHPQLACMDERAYLQDLIDYMQQAGLQYPEDLGRLSATQCAAMRAIYRARVARHVDWSPATRLVDKNPLNLLKLPLLQRVFPHARIVLALRHPADVVLSNYMQNFRSPVFVALCATLESTARGYATAMDFWLDQHALLGGDVFTSRYEDLVGDIAQQSRALLQFLGLPWHDAVLAPHRHAPARGYISTPSYAQVLEPVNTGAVQRWRAYAPWFAPLRPLLDPYLRRWDYTW